MKHLFNLLLVTTAFTFAAASARAQTSACSPFGNAPAQFIQNEVPSCVGGTVLQGWSDRDGTPRYACLFLPTSGASSASPLPLVIFLHPSLTTADVTESGTNFLEYIDSANLSDDSSHPGFILLAPEGRDTAHYYPAPDNVGPGWDNRYRQFTPGTVTAGGVSYPENVDAATNGCLDACGTSPDGDPSNELGITLGTSNHMRWPGNWVPAILDFFRAHPLNSRPLLQ